MRQLRHKFGKLVGACLKDDEGVTAIEYALIAAATGLALAAALPVLQGGLTGTYASILNYFTLVGV